MKRLVLIATLIGAASICTVAFGAGSANVRYFTGKDKDKGCETGLYDCRVYFDGVVKNGRVTTVRYVSLGNIPVRCDDGSHFTSGIGGVYTVKAPIHVNRKRKFSGDWTASLDTSPKAWFQISGTFSKGYKGAAGKLKMSFVDTFPERQICRSKLDELSVHKTPNPPPGHP